MCVWRGKTGLPTLVFGWIVSVIILVWAERSEYRKGRKALNSEPRNYYHYWELNKLCLPVHVARAWKCGHLPTSYWNTAISLLTNIFFITVPGFWFEASRRLGYISNARWKPSRHFNPPECQMRDMMLRPLVVETQPALRLVVRATSNILMRMQQIDLSLGGCRYA